MAGAPRDSQRRCRYLNFLKGIVDSDTLPQRETRHTLQQHDSLKTMKKKLVRKALDTIRKLADSESAAAPQAPAGALPFSSHCCTDACLQHK